MSLVRVPAQGFTAVVVSWQPSYQTTKCVALQKHSNRVKATPGQRYSSRGQTGGSRGWPHFDTSVLTFLIFSVVMGLLFWSIAPSATIMIFSLFIPARFYKEAGGGGETTWQKNWECGCDVGFQKHGGQTMQTGSWELYSFMLTACVCTL